MKKIISILLILSMVCIFPACGEEDLPIPDVVTYYDNVSVVGLAVNAEEDLINPPEFVEISNEVIGQVGGIRLDLCKTYIAKKAEDNRLDEYGIFHCNNADMLETLRKSVENYVNSRKNDDQTLSHYEDAATVKGGKIAVYGNYVVYTFLPDNGNNLFTSCVESLLIE